MAGLGKICEKILLVLSSILLALLCPAMVAGIVTVLTGAALRFIHPESEYQIQTGQIFWSWFMIGTITVAFAFIAANSHSEPADLKD